jgi:RimJ/RimL family protein N-acetyltransferase
MENTKKRVIFIKGFKIILRPMNKETDLEKCWRWINDPEIRKNLKNFIPLNKQSEEEWFDSLSKRSDNIILGIETIDQNNLIGTMGLHKIGWKDRVATTGTLIGEKEFQNKGFGTDAKMFLLHYAFNTLNLRKICSAAWEFNERSIAYNEKCGYKIEGRKKEQIFEDGKYWDEILLAVFKKDWEAVWEKYKNDNEP